MTEMTAEVRRLLDRPNYAHLATLMPDGAPHSVPVWIVIEGDHLAILTGPGSRKARNIERDPRVAISLIDVDQPHMSVLIRGQVVELHRPALSIAHWPDRVLDQARSCAVRELWVID